MRRTCAGVATRRGPFDQRMVRSFPLLCARPNAPQKKSQKATTGNSPDRWPRATDLGSRGPYQRTVPSRSTPARSALDAHRLVPYDVREFAGALH